MSTAKQLILVLIEHIYYLDFYNQKLKQKLGHIFF